MVEVITTGHICVDILPAMDTTSAVSESFLAPGRLVESGALSFTPGGSVSNTGVAFHRLGTSVQLIGRVGIDRIAALTREVLSAHSPALPEHLTVAEGEPSSYTIVISPPGVDRTFLHCPGPNNTFGPEDLPLEILRQARVLHFGYPPLMRRMYSDGGKTLAELFGRARGCGCTTSLDLAMPDPARPAGQADWRQILRGALPLVDLFMPSVEELLFMLDRATYDRVQAHCGAAGMIDALSPEQIDGLACEALALGARVVLLKLGHRGVYLRSGGQAICGRGAPDYASAWSHRQLWSPAYRVVVRGTVGAGDATIAGFITALLRGQSAAKAANSAAAVGACNVEQTDASSGLLTWAQTQARIAAGWARQLCGVESTPGWRHDEQLGVWQGPADTER